MVYKNDKLFDMLNSSEINHPNKFKNAFQGLDYQIDFLEEMIIFLQNIKIYDLNNKDVTSKCKFIKCWMVTIRAIQILWQRLSQAGFKYLKTRRVNQDCLENYFGNVRQQGGNSLNPTPIQFERAFRKLFCQSFFAFGAYEL